MPYVANHLVLYQYTVLLIPATRRLIFHHQRLVNGNANAANANIRFNGIPYYVHSFLFSGPREFHVNILFLVL